MNNFSSLKIYDNEIFSLVKKEISRESNNIELIASENYTSKAVREALGSVLTNKYAEGYPSKRYYNGCEVVDEIESIAIERVKKLFKVEHANVQPYSGSPANLSVFMALLQPTESYLGMDLDSGGHLTHGAKVNFSGKWFNAHSYGVDGEGVIDFNQIRDLAKKIKPKMIIAGGSAYSRIIDFKIFREICDEVGAILFVDMAHFAGIVAALEYPSPVPFADVISFTTHKTLRGPRGGVIITNNESIAKKINSAVFPGLQGGPHMNTIAAKAVAFREAAEPEFKEYILNVVKNSKILSKELQKFGFKIITGGTDTHLILVDTISTGFDGRTVSDLLERANITCNKNRIPNDTTPISKSGGVRLGSPAMTTLGFREAEFKKIASFINDLVLSLKTDNESETVEFIRKEVILLCEKFKISEFLK